MAVQDISKNRQLLTSFILYCNNHPEERFWQALRNWSGFNFVYVSNDDHLEAEPTDTFYFEGKQK